MHVINVRSTKNGSEIMQKKIRQGQIRLELFGKEQQKEKTKKDK